MQAGISALEARLRSPHIRAEQYAQSIWPSTSDAINVKSSHWYNLLVKPVTSLIFLKDCVSRRYPCSISKLERVVWQNDHHDHHFHNKWGKTKRIKNPHTLIKSLLITRYSHYIENMPATRGISFTWFVQISFQGKNWHLGLTTELPLKLAFKSWKKDDKENKIWKQWNL